MPIEKLEYVISVKDESLSEVAKRADRDLGKISRAQAKLTKDFKSGAIGARDYANQMTKLKGVYLQNAAALKSVGVEVTKIDKVFKRGKGSAGGGAGLAIQELGRGIADFNAVGGFQDFSRGALASANNMERMVEIMGFTIAQTGGLKNAFRALLTSLTGPTGVLFAITLLISFGPKLWDAFQQWKDGAEAAKNAQEDLNNEVSKGNITAEEYLTKLQAIGRDRLAQVEKEIALQKRKIAGTALSLASEEHNIKVLEELEAERDALIAQDNLFIEGMLNQSQAMQDAAEAARQYKKRLAELRDQEDISIFEAATPGQDDPYDQFGTDPLQRLFGANPNDAGFHIIDPYLIEDEIDALEDLQSALEMTGSMVAKLSDESAKKWVEANEKFEKSRLTVQGAADSLISAFESAATQGGNLIENLAGGILSAIGSMLIKEGAAYVALGIARNAAFPGSGTKVIGTGAALVAAGTGLKAAGASVARGGRGSGGGGGSAAAGSRPVEQTANTTKSNVTFEIGNNKLIGSLQQGLNKRGTFHGSSNLFPG